MSQEIQMIYYSISTNFELYIIILNPRLIANISQILAKEHRNLDNEKIWTQANLPVSIFICRKNS